MTEFYVDKEEKYTVLRYSTPPPEPASSVFHIHTQGFVHLFISKTAQAQSDLI